MAMSNQKSAIRKWIAQKAVRRPPSMNKCLGGPAWAAPLKADCRKLINEKKKDEYLKKVSYAWHN